MQINFTGHHIDVTPALKEITKKKFDRLNNHSTMITSANVILGVQKLSQTAEATVLIPRGELHACAEADNMYKAIDNLVDKLDKQLLTRKGKVQDHRS